MVRISEVVAFDQECGTGVVEQDYPCSIAREYAVRIGVPFVDQLVTLFVTQVWNSHPTTLPNRRYVAASEYLT